MGVEPNILHFPARNEVKHAYSSHEKVHKIFGDRDLVDLESGIARMAAMGKRTWSQTKQ